MNLYKKMYYHLFNAITDALSALERRNCAQAEELLKTAQQTAEELYLEQRQSAKRSPGP